MAHGTLQCQCMAPPTASQCQCLAPPTTCGKRHTAVPVSGASYYLWPTAHRSASVWRLHLPVARGTSLCLAPTPASGTRHGSANVSLNVCQYDTLTPVLQWRTACAIVTPPATFTPCSAHLRHQRPELLPCVMSFASYKECANLYMYVL